MQFRKALTAATAAVAIIPIVVLAAFEWRNVLSEMDALEKRQRMTAERIAEAINARLSSALELMLLAASELPERFLPNACSRAMRLLPRRPCSPAARTGFSSDPLPANGFST